MAKRHETENSKTEEELGKKDLLQRMLEAQTDEGETFNDQGYIMQHALLIFSDILGEVMQFFVSYK